jgi:flagellar export protein FliJ
MNRGTRLEPLAEYAGNVETEAARRLAVTAKALAVKEREVEQLRGYLAEYRQRAQLADQSTDSLRWQNTRAFLARLSDVVAAREVELQQAVERYRLEAEGWRDSHRRAKSLDKIVADAHREALRESSRREQMELDERTLWRVLGRG